MKPANSNNKRAKVTPSFTVVAGLVLSLLSTSGIASDLSDMLRRMSRADHNQNYQGTFILIKSDELTSLRVTHGSDEKGVWETMETLNGEPNKVIRRDNKVVSVYPSRKLVTIRQDKTNQSLHPQLPENLKQLDIYYAIQQLDDDRIADHQTLVIDLIPRDKLRYGYRYWVDKNTGMLLRCDLVDENRAVVEQMMFTSLHYLPQSPEQTVNISQFEQFKQKVLDEIPVAAVGSATQNSLQAVTNQNISTDWGVKTLPKGFMLMHSNMRNSSSSHAEAKHKPGLLHMVYSDGLASVSVFIEKQRSAQSHLQGASSMGVMNAFGVVEKGYSITVVGEVPMKTVQLMAQSTARIY